MYPEPPALIVAAIATPLSVVILAVASIPVPVRGVRPIPVCVNCPDDGVYPTPALVIVRSPVADPARPTTTPVKSESFWNKSTPIAKLLPALFPSLLTVVPSPTLTVLLLMEMPFLVITSCFVGCY